MDAKKEQIGQAVDALADELFTVSKYLLENPETAYEEFKACDYLSRFLAERDFDVEKACGGVETAFLANPTGCAPSNPKVAILAEYDALPKIGHGCGHNLIAAAGVGAAVALRRVLGDDAGAITMVGTPAEEGGGGKQLLADAGIFKDCDAAMMFHPGQQNLIGQETLGRTKFTLEFFGKTAHAAAGPDQGINALDAMIATFNGISAFRQQMRADGRVHGVITHGGDAPNIIPDYTSALFYVRGATREYRDVIFDRVQKIAEGAALGAGATYKIEVAKPVAALDPMKRNDALEEAVGVNMEFLGATPEVASPDVGSSDIGNLSHYLPSIQPFLAICDTDINIHSVEFAAATQSERGQTAMLNAAKMLAMTAYDFLNQPELRKSAAAEFAGN
ncbi:MAG: M20 family metallopeptidase [Rhodospirillales bacterium]|jgi:amidohydrolase|nr:M20 family metallopeptidase [Rhodospirillales bacterium]